MSGHTVSPLQYRKPPVLYAPERFEALTLKVGATNCYLGGIRPRWMSVRVHRAILRLRMAIFVARAILGDRWDR